MASGTRLLPGLLLGAVLCGAAGAQVPPGFELVKKMAVPAAAGWVDTGLDVLPGQELYFKASGEISLQKGNPSANCGPAGLDLVTVQQPVPNQNLGALIGKIAQLIAVRRDEDTGDEVRDEVAEYVFIGAESGLAAPAKGRLYLGVNEDVVRDNGGEFTVLIYRRSG
ncbi:MAG TPA: hypothetical protein VMS75_05735 [Terriglobales bacterium]|nr:hypothetical protein [Terriglobales bacterium]